jgi:hypothetical protein
MAYDVAPVTTIAEKQSMLKRCVEGGFRLAFPHDPEAGIFAVCGDVRRVEVQPIPTGDERGSDRSS